MEAETRPSVQPRGRQALSRGQCHISGTLAWCCASSTEARWLPALGVLAPPSPGLGMDTDSDGGTLRSLGQPVPGQPVPGLISGCQ